MEAPMTSAPLSTHDQPIRLARERRLALPALTCLAYFTACGGAFGIEPLIGAVGPGWAVVLIFLTPLLWSLPIALMTAELTTLMPEQGGYYVWVYESLGPFWAVQEAWWTMCNTLMLMAIFPVLFVSYLSYLVPWIAPSADVPVLHAGPLIRWGVAVVVIASAMAVNLKGARDVGRSAIAAVAVVLGSFLMLVTIWLAQPSGPANSVSIVARDFAVDHRGALLLGLSTLVFNYSGWDNVSTFASEVDRPQHNYPLAVGGALVLAVLGYILPVLAGISVTTDANVWSADAGWPAIAGLIGGRWLGGVLAAAGLVSMWGLFNAQLLYVSRIPFVMARDGWLPKTLARATPDTAVPKVAIIGVMSTAPRVVEL
jgi:amino acid transporter